jgi:hypothetical protein
MAEMVSMGVGNKALQDIDPSEEAINDRNINYVLKGRGSGPRVGVRKAVQEAVDLCQAWPMLPWRLQTRLDSGLSQPDLLSYAGVRSRASIAVAPLDYDSPHLRVSNSLPGDRASCSVLGSLNLHLYRDPVLLGTHWPLYPPSFPEEAVLEAEVELGSQPSLSMSWIIQRWHGLGLGLLW